MSVNVELLEKAIDENGLSKAELAKIIGMTESTYYRKRQGRFEKLTVGEMHRAVDALHISTALARDIFLA